MIRIAASLAATSQVNLGKTLNDLDAAGVDIIHFDIEDGVFAPIKTLGVRMIKDLRPLTTKPFDVHLMMVNPEWLLPQLAEMGANMVSVHYEACPYPRRTLGIIHDLGMQAGLAFNPKTLIPDLTYCLPFLSFILLLTTEEEIESATYLPTVLKKISKAKNECVARGVQWEVDGGFSVETIQDAKKAGADIIVSGRGVFQDGDIESNINKLKELLS